MTIDIEHIGFASLSVLCCSPSVLQSLSVSRAPLSLSVSLGLLRSPSVSFGLLACLFVFLWSNVSVFEHPLAHSILPSNRRDLSRNGCQRRETGHTINTPTIASQMVRVCSVTKIVISRQ